MMERAKIHYAIAKQIPSLSSQIVINTNYGELSFYDEDAQRIQKLLEKISLENLEKLG